MESGKKPSLNAVPLQFQSLKCENEKRALSEVIQKEQLQILLKKWRDLKDLSQHE